MEVLGVKPNATADEIKLAYRDLVRVWHPDRFAHNKRLQQKAEEKLKEINEAYEQLQSTFAYAGNRQTQPPPAPTSQAIRRASGSAKQRSTPPPRPAAIKAKPGLLAGLKRGRLGAVILLLLSLTALTVWLAKPASIPEQEKRLDPAQLKSREDIFNTLKETRAGAERLLVLHQSELERLTQLYEQRRAQHTRNEISKAELLQAEQALSEAKLRVSEDKKWLAEADVALKEFTARHKSSTSR